MKDAALGWKSALIFTLSLQVAMHAKAAVADMLLVFFVVLAAWAGWEMRGGMKLRWWLIGFGALALGFLAKGPIAWLPLIPMGRQLRFKKDGLAFTAGVVVVLGLVALWGIPALERTNGQFFNVGIGKHVVGRSLATMEGHGAKGLLGYIGTLPFYFLTVFASFAPWSWFLPRLVGQWRTLWQNYNQRYLLLHVALYFGVFTLVKTKLPHYTLPAFPMLALLVAGLLTTLQVRKFAIAMGAFVLLLSLVIFPWAARFFPAPAFAAQSASFLKPEMEFASIEFVEPSLVWSFRKTVHGFHSKVDARKAAAWMKKPGARFYICPAKEVAAAFPAPDPDWKIFHHTGRNFAKGDRTDLTMLLKPN